MVTRERVCVYEYKSMKTILQLLTFAYRRHSRRCCLNSDTSAADADILLLRSLFDAIFQYQEKNIYAHIDSISLSRI